MVDRARGKLIFVGLRPWDSGEALYLLATYNVEVASERETEKTKKRCFIIRTGCCVQLKHGVDTILDILDGIGVILSRYVDINIQYQQIATYQGIAIC